MADMTIGQLAKRTQLNVETIRYYERRGLIGNPARSKSGYRQYSAEAIVRIQFIKRAKELGFSLKEINELLSLRVDPDTTCEMVKAIACDSCNIAVLNLHDSSIAERAENLGIKSVPAVVIDGQLARCCRSRGPDEKTLRAAGLGQSIC